MRNITIGKDYLRFTDIIIVFCLNTLIFDKIPNAIRSRLDRESHLIRSNDFIFKVGSVYGKI